MKNTFFALAASALLLGATSVANALYSTSFEPPDYVAGVGVNGVDGWANGSGSGASQTVSTMMAHSGTQSLEWSNINNLSFYSVRRALPVYSDYIEASVKLYIDGGRTQANRLYGIYFVSTATSTMGGTRLGVTVGGDGVVRGGNTWSSTYSGGGIGTAAAGTYADRWLTLKLQYNVTTGNGTVTVSGFGGAQGDIGTTVAVTPGVLGLNIGSDYFATTDYAGIAYMDDLNVVPEPASMIALGLGAAALIARKRRKTA